MTKRVRRRFAESYRESPVTGIDLALTIANFQILLEAGTRFDSRCTHQQIKDWADRFWWEQWERPFSRGVEVPSDIQAAAELAQEIELQWDMYLANAYTLSQLQRHDFSRVRLPDTWFAGWLARLRSVAEAAEEE